MTSVWSRFSADFMFSLTSKFMAWLYIFVMYAST